MRLTSTFGLAASALALLACEGLNPDQARTVGLEADIQVTATERGTIAVRAELLDPSATDVYLQLEPGERLLAHSEADAVTLEQRGEGAYVWYAAEFPGAALDPTLETELRIELVRTDELDSPSSLVRLPAPFELSEPRAGARYGLSVDALPVAWDVETTDTLRVTLSGPCIYAFQREFAGELMEVALPPGTLQFRPGVTGACDAELQVERIREGVIDQAFSGGRIQARQVRFMQIRVAP